MKIYFWRRLSAIIYDCLFIFALLILATYLILPFTHGRAIAAGTLWYQLYLFTIIFIFFTGSWCRQGQTLGMRAWHLMLQNHTGKLPSFNQATLRFFIGLVSTICLGIGFLVVFFNKDKKTLYDKLARTKIILM